MLNFGLKLLKHDYRAKNKKIKFQNFDTDVCRGGYADLNKNRPL